MDPNSVSVRVCKKVLVSSGLHHVKSALLVVLILATWGHLNNRDSTVTHSMQQLLCKESAHIFSLVGTHTQYLLGRTSFVNVCVYVCVCAAVLMSNNVKTARNKGSVADRETLRKINILK